VGGEEERVIAVHEPRLKDIYPSRASELGLQIVEVALGSGQSSRVG